MPSTKLELSGAIARVRERSAFCIGIGWPSSFGLEFIVPIGDVEALDRAPASVAGSMAGASIEILQRQVEGHGIVAAIIEAETHAHAVVGDQEFVALLAALIDDDVVPVQQRYADIAIGADGGVGGCRRPSRSRKAECASRSSAPG